MTEDVSETDPKRDASLPQPTDYEKAKRPVFLDASRPKSQRTFTAAYRNNWLDLDRDAFEKELSGESDRAAVILAGAHLDELLAFRIARSRPFPMKYPDDFERVFRHDGPLGSFSARTEVARLFDVIDDATYEQLDIIRQMRNVCAHSRRSIDFSDTTVANYAKRLFYPTGFVNPSWAEGKTRRAYTLEVTFIGIILSHGSREEARSIIRDMYARVTGAHTPSPDTRPGR